MDKERDQKLRDKPTVLITGAAGFIGGRLAETLYLQDQVDVRAGLRRWSSAARLARLPLQLVQCDIMNPEQIDRAVADADFIVHCAYNDQRDVIVNGTKNVMAAAKNHGVKQVVFLSTTEIYGAANGEIDETHPGTAPFSPYAAAKREAEAVCAAATAEGLPVTILRPSIVHGPFSGRTIKFAQRLLSEKWGVFGPLGEGRCNLIYIDDVVGAILAALGNPAAYGETFNLNGPELISWNEYFSRFNAALGRPPLPAFSSRQSTARSILRDNVFKLTKQARSLFEDQLMEIYLRDGVAGRAMKRLKNTLFTTPSTAELHTLFNRQATYVADHITKRLGFQPRYSADEGLALCAAWLTHHGYVPEISGRLNGQPQQPDRKPLGQSK